MDAKKIRKLPIGQRVKWIAGDKPEDRGTVKAQNPTILTVEWDNGVMSYVHPGDCVHIEKLA